MRRSKMRIMSLILALISIFSILYLPAYGDGYIGDGGGQSGGTTGKGGTWDTTYSGYRFSIVDNDANLVATPVDFLFSAFPTGNGKAFWTCKAEGFLSRSTRNEVVYISSMLNTAEFTGAGDMPYPMRWVNGPIGQGQELREWLTNGIPFYNSGAVTSGSNSGQTTVTNKEGVTTTTPEDNAPTEDTTGPGVSGESNEDERGNESTKLTSSLAELGNQYSKAVGDMYNYYVSELKYSKDEALDALISWYIPTELSKVAKVLDKTQYDYIKSCMWSKYKSLRVAGIVEFPSLFDGNIQIAYADENSEIMKDVEDGYLKAMLGYKLNEQYVFQFYEGIDFVGTVVDTMANNDFKLIIEPILWFTPTKLASYKVYGTITNINQWLVQEVKEGRIASPSGLTVSGYGNICNIVGPYCLYLDKDLEFNGRTIKGVSMTGTVTYTKMADASYGYAMHSYSAVKGGKQKTQTYDPIEKPEPHPAPDTRGLPILSEDDKRIFNIVKTYVEQDESGEEVHIGTYSRKENPGIIDIMNEPEFKVVEFMYGPDLVETDETTEWRTILSGVRITEHRVYNYDDNMLAAGTALTTVELAEPNTTLYVKLMRKTEDECDPVSQIITNQISESQLTKAISTFDSILGSNWANYWFKAHVDAAQKLHSGGACGCDNDWVSDGKGGGYWDHDPGITSVYHMTRSDSGGDNKVWSTWTGLHTPTTLETKSKAGYNSAFGSTVISGSKVGESITLDKYNGTNVVSDTAHDWELDKNYVTENGIAYFTTIWRGSKDPNVTLASYKKNAINSTSWERVVSLFSAGNKPVGKRMTERISMYSDMLITLGIKDKDGTVTSACYDRVHSCCCYNISPISSSKSLVYSTSDNGTTEIDFTGDFTVRGYAGSTKVTSSTHISDIKGAIMSFNGGVSKNTALYATKGQSSISFYPYIRMSYMTTQDGYESSGWTEAEYSNLTSGTAGQQSYLDSRTVYVLSDKLSEIIPTNSIEIGWYNSKQTSGDYGINMTSTQWSLHKGATDQSEKWKQPNSVLPGGALYMLSTEGSETVVKAVSYSTLVDPDSRSWISVDDSSAYTIDSVVSENEGFITELRDCLENLKIVQWVNKNFSLSTAWERSSTAVKVVNGGESLSNLGLTGKASTDDKYKLFGPSANNEYGASEGDIDIQRQGYQTTIYIAFTDTEGNVYIASAAAETSPEYLTKSQLTQLVNVLKNTNGTNEVAASSSGISTQIVRIGSKNQSTKEILDGLKDSLEYNQLYALEVRTGLISNVVNAVTRNQGDDSLNAWVDDEKWYNEAFDGIYVVQQTMTYQIGLQVPTKRVSVLDPSLCPSKSGTGDLFKTAHISQFRLDSKSCSSYATGKADGYVGSFFGMDVVIPEMENMYISRPFYIPNANVQDLV